MYYKLLVFYQMLTLYYTVSKQCTKFKNTGHPCRAMRDYDSILIIMTPTFNILQSRFEF